jgi:hypothetical protein
VPTNNMPGFTAEASDYVSERGYSSRGGIPGQAPASGVFPSLLAPSYPGLFPWWPCCLPKPRGRAMRVAANAGAPMTDQDFCDAIGGGMMTTSSGGSVCVLARDL